MRRSFLVLMLLSLALGGCVEHAVEVAAPGETCPTATAFAPAPQGYPVRLAKRAAEREAAVKALADSGWNVSVDDLGYVTRATHPGSSAVGSNGAAIWSDDDRQLVEAFVAREQDRLGLRGAELQLAPRSYSCFGKAATALVPVELAALQSQDPHVAELPPAVVARKEYVGGGLDGDRFELQITGHRLVGLTIPQVQVRPEEVLRRWGRVHEEPKTVSRTCDFGCDGGSETIGGVVGEVAILPMVVMVRASETEVELRRVGKLVVAWTNEPYHPATATLNASIPAQCLPWAVDLVTGETLSGSELVLEVPDPEGDWAGAASP